MLGKINEKFNDIKARERDNAMIVESVVNDLENTIDANDIDDDSVPADVYNKVDKALTDIVSKSDYDDTSVEELVDDDDTASINIIIDEAASEF